jgi:phage-related minor tail protein
LCMKTSLGYKLIVPLAVVGLGLFAAGCGSDEPDYCSDVSTLEQSVNDLADLKLESGVLSELQSDLSTIQSNAKAVEQSAKQDFPDETSALETSVSKLSKSIDKLPESPTTEQLVGLAPEISAVVDADKELDSATESACD